VFQYAIQRISQLVALCLNLKAEFHLLRAKRRIRSRLVVRQTSANCISQARCNLDARQY